MKYWVPTKFSAKAQEKQLTDYTDGIANGNLGAPQPNEPTWALPADPPVAVPPGIKKRFREIAGEIKAQKSIYTHADGELLGIIPPDEAGLSPDNNRAGFEIEINHELRSRSRLSQIRSRTLCASNFGIKAEIGNLPPF